MKLLGQLLEELGAHDGNSYMVVIGYGVYFCNVVSVNEFSSQKMVVRVGKHSITVEGENLSISKYFERDLFVLGKVRGTYVDE
jgi:hypothetical protein